MVDLFLTFLDNIPLTWKYLTPLQFSNVIFPHYFFDFLFCHITQLAFLYSFLFFWTRFLISSLHYLHLFLLLFLIEKNSVYISTSLWLLSDCMDLSSILTICFFSTHLFCLSQSLNMSSLSLNLITSLASKFIFLCPNPSFDLIFYLNLVTTKWLSNRWPVPSLRNLHLMTFL